MIERKDADVTIVGRAAQELIENTLEGLPDVVVILGGSFSPLEISLVQLFFFYSQKQNQGFIFIGRFHPFLSLPTPISEAHPFLLHILSICHLLL